jgi:hypothetical protein
MKYHSRPDIKYCLFPLPKGGGCSTEVKFIMKFYFGKKKYCCCKEVIAVILDDHFAEVVLNMIIIFLITYIPGICLL